MHMFGRERERATTSDSPCDSEQAYLEHHSARASTTSRATSPPPPRALPTSTFAGYSMRPLRSYSAKRPARHPLQPFRRRRACSDSRK